MCPGSTAYKRRLNFLKLTGLFTAVMVSSKKKNVAVLLGFIFASVVVYVISRRSAISKIVNNEGKINVF